MKTIAIATLTATLVNLAILIAVGAKLQVAKEDFAAAVAGNPLLNLVTGLFKK